VLVDLLSDQTEQAGVDTEEEEEDDSLDVSRSPLLSQLGSLTHISEHSTRLENPGELEMSLDLGLTASG
jgi:hypothetical protein